MIWLTPTVDPQATIVPGVLVLTGAYLFMAAFVDRWYNPPARRPARPRRARRAP